jgi:hypothetical protein
MEGIIRRSILPRHVDIRKMAQAIYQNLLKVIVLRRLTNYRMEVAECDLPRGPNGNQRLRRGCDNSSL